MFPMIGTPGCCHILVLDDEPLILLDLQYAVEDAGCVALTAMDCREAMTIIEARTITAAILDVSLGPAITCEPVVRALVDRHIPYVLHTGDADRLDAAVRSLGGSVIPKPTPAAKVVENVLSAVAVASK